MSFTLDSCLYFQPSCLLRQVHTATLAGMKWRSLKIRCTRKLCRPRSRSSSVTEPSPAPSVAARRSTSGRCRTSSSMQGTLDTAAMRRRKKGPATERSTSGWRPTTMANPIATFQRVSSSNGLSSDRSTRRLNMYESCLFPVYGGSRLWHDVFVPCGFFGWSCLSLVSLMGDGLSASFRCKGHVTKRSKSSVTNLLMRSTRKVSLTMKNQPGNKNTTKHKRRNWKTMN